METRQKILLLDDDQDLLDLYKEILTQLPSRPEVHTAQSGSRAMALLEAEPFAILICDLNMPKMDGLQVLSIVRRKYPQLRTVVLTAVLDEQFRSRVYALGVDLYWQKPSSQKEIKMFVECLESLLGREEQNGFRGVQNKSLVDIIQLECISQNSTALKITHGPITGKIWIQDGEVIDAVAEELQGEEAFKKILSWKTGAFENLPAEPERPRTIAKSYNALLLETAQAFDESQRQDVPVASTQNISDTATAQDSSGSPLSRLSRLEGVEFALALKPGDKLRFDSRGLENPEPVAAWTRETMDRFRSLGDRLRAGSFEQIECVGPQRNVAIASHGDSVFCVGWKHTISAREMREMMNKILWVS